MLAASPGLAGLDRTALQHGAERGPRSAGRMAAMLERWLENRRISSADLPAVTLAALAGGGLPHSDVAQRRWEPVPSFSAIEPAPMPEAPAKPARRSTKGQSANAPGPLGVAPAA